METTKDISILVDKTMKTLSDDLQYNIPIFIVLHSTEKHSTYESLYNLHTQTYGWKGVGYHIFITNGRAYQSRDLGREGAHCLGLNFNSIGLCINTKDLEPSETDKQLARYIVEKIKSKYGFLQMISHTKAQLRYINKLSTKKGLFTGIPEIEIRSDQEFEALKRNLNDFSKEAHMEKHPYLQSLITNFKNCPGAGFYDFINAMNQDITGTNQKNQAANIEKMPLILNLGKDYLNN